MTVIHTKSHFILFGTLKIKFKKKQKAFPDISSIHEEIDQFVWSIFTMHRSCTRGVWQVN